MGKEFEGTELEVCLKGTVAAIEEHIREGQWHEEWKMPAGLVGWKPVVREGEGGEWNRAGGSQVWCPGGN